MSGTDSKQNRTDEKSRSIIELSAEEAHRFLLKDESYCSIDLPVYITFSDLINAVDEHLKANNLSDLKKTKPSDFDDINYRILSNKDGRYSWRPLSLIHPALYVSLVNQITDEDNWNEICTKFKSYSKNDKIRCLSLPVVSLGEEKDKAEQISHWWLEVEQKSIELALDYQYVIETDISDCYGSIYTHSIAWALHTKAGAKEKRLDKTLVGNIIDTHIRDMQHGQTNGIPQGSVLMDLIAEMVLGYADLELYEKIKHIEDYQILRYRDDYRIFTNNPQHGDMITKCLTEVLIDLGLKLSPLKTKLSNSVIRASIKDEKLNWIGKKHYDRDFQMHLLIIHDHGIQFPNSGSLDKALQNYQKRISKLKEYDQTIQLISIVVDIAYRNPRTYPICFAIISKLLSILEEEKEKEIVIEKIKKRFHKIPNTGHMEIWLQRVTIPFLKDQTFDEPICKLVAGESVSIWNNEWIASNDLKTIINADRIVDREIIEKLDLIIPAVEIEIFSSKAKGYSYE